MPSFPGSKIRASVERSLGTHCARVACVDQYKNKWLIAIAVTLGSVIELIDTSIVNVALPHMSANLGATLDEVTWVAVGYILSSVIILPMTGWLAAFFGRTQYYVGSIVIFTISSFFCGAAHSLVGLVFWRIMQGVGGGALIATSQSILYEAFPPTEQTLAAAVFGIGMMLGPAIGPTLGGYIVDRYEWPWIFYINLPIGFIAAILSLAFVPAKPKQTTLGPFDFLGFVLLTIGLGSLQFVLERGEHYDWFESTLIRWLTVVASVGLVAFIVWELYTDHPVIRLRLLRHRSLAAGVLIMAGVGVALYGSVFALPQLTQNVLGYDATTTGLVMLPGAIGAAIAMFAVARIPRSVDLRLVSATGGVILVISMYMHGSLSMQISEGTLFWPVFLRGIGVGFMFVPVAASTVAGLRGNDLAEGSAMFNLSRQLGGSFGLAFLATKVATGIDLHRSALVAHVAVGAPRTQRYLQAMAAVARAHGADPYTATRKAHAMLDNMVNAQALMLTYNQIFKLVGIIVVCIIPLILLQRKPTGGAGAPAH
jgi:DHA2 family multidrug resistance protein